MNNNLFSAMPGLGADPLSRPSANIPTSARVYGEIRRQIIALELPPETILARAELAEQFGVSQSPVREAISRLALDGLVISYPQSRTVVSKIDAHRIRDEHFLRLAAECEVARQLADGKDAGALSKAKGYLKLQEAIVGDVEQVQLFRQLDEAFHQGLFEGIQQKSLHHHISGYCGNLARLRTLDLPRKGKMESVLDDHKAIIAAIETWVGETATKAMRQHLSGTIERLPKIAAEHKGLFV